MRVLIGEEYYPIIVFREIWLVPEFLTDTNG